MILLGFEISWLGEQEQTALREEGDALWLNNHAHTSAHAVHMQKFLFIIG